LIIRRAAHHIRVLGAAVMRRRCIHHRCIIPVYFLHLQGRYNHLAVSPLAFTSLRILILHHALLFCQLLRDVHIAAEAEGCGRIHGAGGLASRCTAILSILQFDDG